MHLRLTFLFLMTATSQYGFVIMHTYSWSLVLLTWPFWKMRRWLKRGSHLLLSENVIPPPLNKTSTLFVIYLHKTLSSFILQCLYHYKVVAKPAKIGSLGYHPGPPSNSIIYCVKTSCLGGGEDRCEEGICSHIGLALSPSCPLRALQTGSFTTGWSIMLASHTWAMFSSQLGSWASRPYLKKLSFLSAHLEKISWFDMILKKIW